MFPAAAPAWLLPTYATWLRSSLADLAYTGVTPSTTPAMLRPRTVRSWNVKQRIAEFIVSIAPDAGRVPAKGPPTMRDMLVETEEALVSALAIQVLSPLQNFPPAPGTIWGVGSRNSGAAKVRLVPDFKLVTRDKEVLIAGGVQSPLVMPTTSFTIDEVFGTPGYPAVQDAFAQLYLYMRATGARYGILTTYHRTWLVHRHSDDELEVSRGARMQANATSASQVQQKRHVYSILMVHYMQAVPAKVRSYSEFAQGSLAAWHLLWRPLYFGVCAPLFCLI